MSRKTPRSKLLAGKGIQERFVPSRPQKLPTMKRGGSLRVGRLVFDARSSSTWDNQSSSVFVQEEERRVQEELAEMLVVKLANKEKEVEILRCKQNVVDQQFAGYDRQLQQQQEAHARVVGEMTVMNQELQRQVQLLQIECERLQVDSEAQHAAALEQRRLREKEQTQTRLNNETSQRVVQELRVERQQIANDRFALESTIQRMLQDQQAQSSSLAQLEARCAQLEDELQSAEESCQQLQEALGHEGQQRKDVEATSRKLEEEKLALEEKQRALMKTLKSASSKVTDLERKKSELTQAENQLTEQLAALKRENGELKARRGQMSSQTKHLQARIAALESANTVQEKKLEDATTELDSARKYCRDSQFRTKQLQEEIVFLKNRKPAATDNAATFEVQDAVPETDTADDMPCWMKG